MLGCESLLSLPTFFVLVTLRLGVIESRPWIVGRDKPAADHEGGYGCGRSEARSATMRPVCYLYSFSSSRSACRCSHLRIWGRTRQPCKRRVCVDIGRKAGEPKESRYVEPMPRIHPDAAYDPFVFYVRYLNCVEHVAYSDEFGRRFQQCAAVCSDSIRPCIPIGFDCLFRYCAAIYRSEATKGISNVSLPVM